MGAAAYSPSILPPPPAESCTQRSGAVLYIYLRMSLFDLFYSSLGRGEGWVCKDRSSESGFSRPGWYEAMTAGGMD